jgi:serine/threonine protein kinase
MLTQKQEDLLTDLVREVDEYSEVEARLNSGGFRVSTMPVNQNGKPPTELARWRDKVTWEDFEELEEHGFLRIRREGNAFYASLTNGARSRGISPVIDSATATLPKGTAPISEPLPVGYLLGRRYRVVATLGNGAMAFVYRATDDRLSVEVAIKVPKASFWSKAHAPERFRREVKSAMQVRHMNVCPIQHYDEDGPTPFCVMPHVEGETLQQRLERGPLPEPEALEVVHQIAAGLDAIHAEGIVHRDIKPANLMLSKARVLILDLGIAKDIDDAKLTGTGDLLGTPSYMSPEQCSGGAPTAASDVYSLALVAYELLVGTALFKGTVGEVFAKQIGQEPDLSAIPSVGLRRTIARGLRKDVGSRHSTAGEFAEDLRQALHGSDWEDTETETIDRRIDEEADAEPLTILPIGGRRATNPDEVWPRLGAEAHELLAYVWQNIEGNFIYESQTSLFKGRWGLGRWKSVLNMLIDREGLMVEGAQRPREGAYMVKLRGYGLTAAGRTLMASVTPHLERRAHFRALIEREFVGSPCGTGWGTYGGVWSDLNEKERTLLLRLWEKSSKFLYGAEIQPLREEWGESAWSSAVVKLRSEELVQSIQGEYGGLKLTEHGQRLMSELVRAPPTE